MNNKELVRFGCHRFLNSRPFSDYLLEHSRELGISLRFDHPARLADALKAGKLDLAFIPSIEYLNLPGGRIVPDISISSRGEVRTVLLVCSGELSGIKSIAVDERSRTSVAMLKIILKKRGVGPVALSPMAPEIGDMLKGNDAAMVIGDAAFGVNGLGLDTYDLSSEWFRLTGKTFVHAIIAAAPNWVACPRVLEGIREAKRSMPDMAAKIVHREAVRLNISQEACSDYLTNKIRYDLGPEEIEGLSTFYKMAIEGGLAGAGSASLRFLEAP